MPNHVTNEIRVVGGTNKQRLAFIRAITNKFGLIDFNNICKRPKVWTSKKAVPLKQWRQPLLDIL